MNAKIRQGGMGLYISTPFLANSVSRKGGIGTVSGVAADRVVARILQLGDFGGHFRRALANFPFKKMADWVVENYFVEGGVEPGTPFKKVPIFTLPPTEKMITLTICANFALVWLAKESHKGEIAINYLEKIQMPHVYNFVGAMLAGVDCITMGAGIPNQVPGILDSLSSGCRASYEVDVEDGENKTIRTEFDSEKFFGTSLSGLHRPDFVPIVSTDVLASFLAKKSSGAIQGIVVEGPTAGGHNAPPRGKLLTNSVGEPIYGERDRPNWAKLRELELPFWVGGGCASPAALSEAVANGASGIQVGSIFALCNESGLEINLRIMVCKMAMDGPAKVRTSLTASPTGFPFKVLSVPSSIADVALYCNRASICNQGVLLKPFVTKLGSLGYRCSAEPIDVYLAKGGKKDKTAGVYCICNGLMSAAGLGDYLEPATVTLGDDLSFVAKLTDSPARGYSVADAMKYLLGS